MVLTVPVTELTATGTAEAVAAIRLGNSRGANLMGICQAGSGQAVVGLLWRDLARWVRQGFVHIERG